jgi:twinkle protein
MNVQEYLTSKGYSYNVVKRPSGYNAVMECPKCHDRDKSFAIDIESGAFNCMRLNKCGWKGSFRDFQLFHNDTPKSVVSDRDFKEKKKEYQLPKHTPEEISADVYEFFRKRFISRETVEHFKVGKLRTAVAFKYFEDGKFVNAKYRGMTEKKFHQEKGARPVLYNRDNVPEDSEELVICEGEIDAMSWHQSGFPNVVSINSGASDKRWIEYNWDWLKRFKKIYLSMDMDEAGQKEVDDIAKRLGNYRVYSVELPYKDANECLLEGEPPEKFQAAIATANGFERPELRNASEYADELVDTILHPEKYHGRNTGIPFLDDTIKGWRGGEVTVWTGRSASGKTTALMQVVMYDIIEQSKKGNFLPACIGSFEMRPEMLLEWAISQIRYYRNAGKGKAWEDGAWTEEEIRQYAKDYLWPLYIVNIKDKVNEDTIFDLFEFAAQKYGCKVFVLDSLMRIGLNRQYDALEAQKAFMDRLARFADKFDCHVHLVAHPRKGEKDSDIPDKSSIKGAGEITDMAHNVISIYRLSDEALSREADKQGIQLSSVPSTKWRVIKNRVHGVTRSEAMHFNFRHKTFYQRS